MSGTRSVAMRGIAGARPWEELGGGAPPVPRGRPLPAPRLLSPPRLSLAPPPDPTLGLSRERHGLPTLPALSLLSAAGRAEPKARAVTRRQGEVTWGHLLRAAPPPLRLGRRQLEPVGGRAAPSPPLSEGPGQRPRTPGARGGAGSPGSAARSPAQRGWEPGEALGQVGAAGRVSWWGCAAAADGSCVVLGGFDSRRGGGRARGKPSLGVL